MDYRAAVILLAEALFTLVLLYFSGLLKKPAAVVISAALIVAAFGLRFACLPHVTLDYENFLSGWVQFFRDNGGFAALSQSVGNYNVPYLYFLAAFSYGDIPDLYLIKLTSIAFDVLLAWSAMRLGSLFIKDKHRLLGLFFTVLLLPTVILNGAYWGQCDSIYVAFAVLSIYLALSGRPGWGMAMMAVSFSFKLQAVFVMPIFAALLLAKRVKLWQFAIFPAVYLLMVLPAVLLGRPLWDTVTLYFDQMGSVGSGLNYNSSSIFAFVTGSVSEGFLSALGIAAAFAFMLLILALLWGKGERATGWMLLAAAVLFAIAIPYFLPHMHDRYFFAADILSVCFAFALPRFFAVPMLVQFASLLGYHAYLRMRYLLPMSYGAAALALALCVVFAFFIGQINWKRNKSANT